MVISSGGKGSQTDGLPFIDEPFKRHRPQGRAFEK
jgi:hypothetical protein